MHRRRPRRAHRARRGRRPARRIRGRGLRGGSPPPDRPARARGPWWSPATGHPRRGRRGRGGDHPPRGRDRRCRAHGRQHPRARRRRGREARPAADPCVAALRRLRRRDGARGSARPEHRHHGHLVGTAMGPASHRRAHPHHHRHGGRVHRALRSAARGRGVRPRDPPPTRPCSTTRPSSLPWWAHCAGTACTSCSPAWRSNPSGPSPLSTRWPRAPWPSPSPSG